MVSVYLLNSCNFNCYVVLPEWTDAGGLWYRSDHPGKSCPLGKSHACQVTVSTVSNVSERSECVALLCLSGILSCSHGLETIFYFQSKEGRC
jgi:hypothetical protein